MSTPIQNWFRRVFRGGQTAPISAATAVETAPLSPEQLASVSQTEKLPVLPPQFVVGVGQSPGLQRDHNEDTLYVLQSVLAVGKEDIPFGIFVVADGMGGHLNGEVASACAARALAEYVVTKLYAPFVGGRGMGENSLHEVMEAAVAEAQRAVVRNAPGGGTTLTAALVLGDQVTLTHVGDSRACFLHPGGRLEVVTQDHSLVKRLQDLGQIDEKEASVHPQRNVLYRALGQSEPFQPDINTHTLPEGGYLLLCSDGLWAYVDENEIHRIVYAEAHPAMAAQKLIEAANAAGGPDNISAVLVQYLR